jgi:hypothetical protein
MPADQPIRDRIESRRAARQPRRSKAKGLALIIAALILAAIFAVLLFTLSDDLRFWIIGGTGLFLGASWMIDVGRRMRTLDGWELLRNDPRPPVLYLRPFQEDNRRTYSAPVGPRQGGESVPSATGTPATRERAIARQLSRIGPFVAVGKPGDSLAPLGAARIYVTDDQWQSVVTSLVKQAAAIILQPEVSPGALWELVLVGRSVDPRRVLLLVPDPFVRPLGFARIRELADTALAVTLPPAGECPACDAFIFDERRQPLSVTLKSAAALNPFVLQVLQLAKPKVGPP